MRYLISFCLFFAVFSVNIATAQFGVRLKYNTNKYERAETDLSAFFGNAPILNRGYGLGIDYWFRLKNYRIEFLPEIYYSYNSSTNDKGIIDGITLSRAGFNMNIQFYPMDFEEDCDCPTFSKEGPNFTKGFFFHISPGVSYDMMQMDSEAGIVNENDHMNFKLGGGVGLDIGFTDLITVTPMYTYNYFIGDIWTIVNFPVFEKPTVTTRSNTGQHQFALRVGFRLDY